MSKIYFTLTGIRYYHGNEFLKPGMKLKLKKEPDNNFDKEAIVVKKEGLGECRLYWLSCLRVYRRICREISEQGNKDCIGRKNSDRQLHES